MRSSKGRSISSTPPDSRSRCELPVEPRFATAWLGPFTALATGAIIERMSRPRSAIFVNLFLLVLGPLSLVAVIAWLG